MKEKSLILVLDDDPDICIMIKMVLDYYGYDAMDAENEENAKKIISTNHVDLLIMDMLLSGVDGTDICRQLKHDKATSSIPILMFSAHPTAKETCLAAGADDFISKPFEMNDMMDKISFFLERKKIGQQ
jgi:two-component system alkaline phosphatase synthesis response regulator PhoP